MEAGMHSRINAAIAFAITLALLAFGLGTATASAEEYITVDGSGSILQAGGWNQPATSDDSLQVQSAADVKGFQRALVSAIEGWNGTDSSISVDISEFNIPNDNDYYFDLYSGFLNAHGEYFYLSHMMSYARGDSNAERAIISFDLSYTKADIDAFNSRVHQIMGEVGATWNDEQKALFLHDYLVSHCQYDLTYSNYNAYNALIEKSAVCQGYSEAYDYLLRLAGLEDDVVSSQALDHAWNLVTIDGRRYYVDCTWDDPSNLKRPAYVGHENLLRSTAGITATGHESTDWIGTSGDNVYDAGAANTSTKYDSHYWSDCTSIIPHIGNLWAYTTSSGIYAHNYSSGADIQLVASLETWPVVGSSNSYWPGNYSSLASTGGAFVYTDARNVYTITASGVKTTRYTLTSSQESQGYIYSLIYNEETGDYDCSWYKQYDSDPAGTVSLDLATHVSSVSVSPGSASGELGTTLQLSVTISPADALNQAVSWSSSDESVATVNRDGLVSLLKKGTATITAKSQDKGKTGTATITVTGHPMADADIDLQDAEGLIYNTKAHKPSVTAIWNGVALEEGVDYQVDYSDNTAAGTAKATITGTEAGDFEGAVVLEFDIAPVDLENAQVMLTPESFLADGVAHVPQISIDVEGVGTLRAGEDYDASYDENASSPGTYEIKISGKGNFTGEVPLSYEITETKTVADAAGVSFTYKIEDGKATVVNIEANGATEIVVPETLEGNADGDGTAQALAVDFVTKDALAGNGQVTSLVVKSASTELEEGALEGIAPNASVTAPAGSPAAKAAAQHDEAVAAAAANAISDMLPALEEMATTKALTAENKQAVANARAAYEALSPAQQALATEALGRIEAAEAQLVELEDQAAADGASTLIGKLPAKVASDADAEAVKAARKAYDALSEAQKAKVDPAIVAQLEAAEGAAKEYAAAREKAAEPEKPLPKGAVEIAGSGASKARYKVTASATAKAPGQVSYMQAQTGKAKAANVPATVKIGNYTYKVTAIGANAFKGNTSITSVAIGANVADIGANAFAKCTRLAKVTGAANVASIGASAFSGCKALKTFTLGAKATKVGAKAFFNCKKLAKLTIKSKKLKSVGKQALKGTAAKLTVKSPKAKKAAYKRMLGKAGASKKAKFK